MICQKEGKKKQTDIAQVLEILKALYTLDAEMRMERSINDCPLWELGYKSDILVAKMKDKKK